MSSAPPVSWEARPGWGWTLEDIRSDERYNWVVVRLTEIDRAGLREIVEDGWRMVVLKRLAAEVLGPL